MKHFLYTLFGFLYVELHPRIVWLSTQTWWFDKLTSWNKASCVVYDWENARLKARVEELKSTIS